MPVHAVMLRFGHDIGLGNLPLHLRARFTLGHHVAAEFAGQHHQRAIEQAAGFQIENQLGHRRVDGLLHSQGALMAIFVGIPIAKRNVLGGHFDKARAGFHQAASEQAAQAS